MALNPQTAEVDRGSRRRAWPWLIGAAVLALVAVLVAFLRDDRPDDWRVVPHRFVADLTQPTLRPQAIDLSAAIQRSTAYLVANCQADGKFVYLRDLERPRFRSTDYNVLRHAGAIYVLCQRQAWQPSDEVVPTVERAVKFLQRETFMRLPGRDDLLAIWSPPELIGSASPLEAKLGGTGLGLAALVAAESVTPGLTSSDELTRAWVSF